MGGSVFYTLGVVCKFLFINIVRLIKREKFERFSKVDEDKKDYCESKFIDYVMNFNSTFLGMIFMIVMLLVIMVCQ